MDEMLSDSKDRESLIDEEKFDEASFIVQTELELIIRDCSLKKSPVDEGICKFAMDHTQSNDTDIIENQFNSSLNNKYKIDEKPSTSKSQDSQVKIDEPNISKVNESISSKSNLSLGKKKSLTKKVSFSKSTESLTKITLSDKEKLEKQYKSLVKKNKSLCYVIGKESLSKMHNLTSGPKCLTKTKLSHEMEDISLLPKVNNRISIIRAKTSLNKSSKSDIMESTCTKKSSLPKLNKSFNNCEVKQYACEADKANDMKNDIHNKLTLKQLQESIRGLKFKSNSNEVMNKKEGEIKYKAALCKLKIEKQIPKEQASKSQETNKLIRQKTGIVSWARCQQKDQTINKWRHIKSRTTDELVVKGNQSEHPLSQSLPTNYEIDENPRNKLRREHTKIVARVDCKQNDKKIKQWKTVKPYLSYENVYKPLDIPDEKPMNKLRREKTEIVPWSRGKKTDKAITRFEEMENMESLSSMTLELSGSFNRIQNSQLSMRMTEEIGELESDLISPQQEISDLQEKPLKTLLEVRRIRSNSSYNSEEALEMQEPNAVQRQQQISDTNRNSLSIVSEQLIEPSVSVSSKVKPKEKTLQKPTSLKSLDKKTLVSSQKVQKISELPRELHPVGRNFHGFMCTFFGFLLPDFLMMYISLIGPSFEVHKTIVPISFYVIEENNYLVPVLHFWDFTTKKDNHALGILIILALLCTIFLFHLDILRKVISSKELDSVNMAKYLLFIYYFLYLDIFLDKIYNNCVIYSNAFEILVFEVRGKGDSSVKECKKLVISLLISQVIYVCYLLYITKNLFYYIIGKIAIILLPVKNFVGNKIALICTKYSSKKMIGSAKKSNKSLKFVESLTDGCSPLVKTFFEISYNDIALNTTGEGDTKCEESDEFDRILKTNIYNTTRTHRYKIIVKKKRVMI